MKMLLLRTLAAAGAAMAAVGPANAATEVFSQTFGPTGLVAAPFPVFPLISLHKFDPTLGTLQGVTLTLDLTAANDILFENFGASPHNVTLNAVSTVNFSGTGIPSFSSIVNFSPIRNVTAFDGSFDYAGTSGFHIIESASAGPVQFIVGPSSFANFIGLGNYSGTLSGSLLPTVQGISNNDFSSGFGSNASGKVTVTYLFAAVPEPSTWGTIILGFAMIGLSLKRRRNLRAVA